MKKILRKARNKARNLQQYLDFVYKIEIGQPYFGNFLLARQVDPKRIAVMERFIRKELESASPSFKLLEIGSWAGMSTVLWASECKRAGKGTVFCVDTWKGADNTPQLRGKLGIFKLFLHNLKASGVEDYVTILKADSHAISEILKDESFDVVYIDGDHSYSGFKKDLSNYMRTVKKGGVICGDDLEVQPSAADLENARQHSEEDYIIDTKTNTYFHPGITLGILDVFGGDINAENGFWFKRL